MAQKTATSVFRQTNLSNESQDYLAKREDLRIAELELMRQQERVAALRRKLPEGAPIQDYEFVEGPSDLDAGDSPTRKVRLSELFTGPDRSVIVYHLMFGKKQSKPCPMCTQLVDGLNGVAQHVAQRADLAIVAAADPPALRGHARARGWNRLRLLSAGSSTFKSDLGSEDREGNQDSEISVFTRGSDGVLRHFYSAHPRLAEDVKERGLDLICPLWTLFDLTPQGRGDFYAKLEYPAKTAHGD